MYNYTDGLPTNSHPSWSSPSSWFPHWSSSSLIIVIHMVILPMLKPISRSNSWKQKRPTAFLPNYILYSTLCIVHCTLLLYIAMHRIHINICTIIFKHSRPPSASFNIPQRFSVNLISKPFWEAAKVLAWTNITVEPVLIILWPKTTQGHGWLVGKKKEYPQDSPPQDCPPRGQSWGGESWYPGISRLPTPIICCFLCSELIWVVF